MSVTKRKRVSRKTKVSWRKHVDLTDVEEFLEDRRLEERLGLTLDTLSNDELFKVDTKPSDVQSVKDKRQLKLQQPPRCFTALWSHTSVPDPIKKRNRVRSKEERKNDVLKKKEKLNRDKGVLKHKNLVAIHNRKMNARRQELKHKRGQYDEDIWEEDKINENNGWLFKDTVKNNLTGTGKIRMTLKRKVRKNVSVISSVEKPHPGMSYNPSFKDHQDLLKIIAEKEAEVIKKENHLNRVTKDMFSKVTANRRDANWLQEMSEGLPQQNEEENESDGEYKAINLPAKNKKKTLKQKRKQKEQTQQELLRKKLKVQKQKVTDIHQLRLLKEQIQKHDDIKKKMRELRKVKEASKKKQTKRLGALKFEESELEFNMGSDISGNLRSLKKEGNLVADRFRSLQKRNIIEPTIKQHKKKAKVKRYTKPGHKKDWIETVARSKL